MVMYTPEQEEDIVLEGDEEEEIELEQTLPELPPDLRHIMLTDFPPNNPKSSGFASTLVDLMTKADNFNLVRLFEAFPVYGVAYMLWDEGLVEYTADRRNINFRAEHADKASILDIQDWHEKCRTLMSVLNYSRVTHNGHVINDRKLAEANEFGSY